MSLKTSSPSNQSGFGTFTGVFVPNITMMCGVILFLRLSFVVGQVGLFQFLGIILLSLTVMSITALSIAMVCSNMKVGGGGAYYIISRSLGVEIGGAIGLALILNQLLCMVLCISGFAQSVQLLYPSFSLWTIEVIALLAISALCLISTDFVLKTQTLIFLCLIVSVGSIFLGSGIIQKGTEAHSPFSYTFWPAFALFYPALTGIEVGMSLSGTLKNPSRSLTIGSISSLITMGILYSTLGIFLWNTYPRISLASDPNLLLHSAKIPELVYFGVWCASLSSAIGNFIGAPRMMQTVAQDGIIPAPLGYGYGLHKEPRWSVVFVLVIGSLLLMTTTIDELLPMLTMICLLTYGTLNFVAGITEKLKSPSWRPTFHCPWQLCILGSLLCLFLMLMIQPAWALISIGIVISLYLYLSRRDLQTSFDDLRESLLLYFSRLALYNLFAVDERPHNWHPKILICSVAPMQYETMMHLGHAMTKRNGLLTVASIIPEDWGNSADQIEKTRQLIKDWLDSEQIQAITEVSAYPNFYEGVNNYIKSYGIGSLQPNCILLDFPENEWSDEFLSVIETAKTYNKNLLLASSPDNYFQSAVSKKKTIHLWWDQTERESSELLISLLLSLRQSKRWQKKSVLVHAVASDPQARKHLNRHLKRLFTERRIPVKVRTHVDPREDPLFFLPASSREADLIFFPLRLTDNEDYETYFKRVQTFSPQTPFIAASYHESLSHKEIYHTDEHTQHHS